MSKVQITINKDANTIVYHRNPTPGEVTFGEGAIHYRDFPREDVTKKNGDLKKWFIAEDDGLRYYY